MRMLRLVCSPTPVEPQSTAGGTSDEVAKGPGYPFLPRLPNTGQLPPHIPGTRSSGSPSQTCADRRPMHPALELFINQEITISNNSLKTIQCKGTYQEGYIMPTSEFRCIHELYYIFTLY
jgi:hypothetical protein